MKAHVLAATSLLAILASASPAFAEAADQPSAANAESGEILVTARRVEERLQDVPVAVTVVSGATLQRFGVSGPVDLRTVTAGLNVSTAAGRPATALYAIRGQKLTDQVITNDPPVALYQDDVLVSPLAGSNTGLFDIANVQVLKGPQGTLFGRNTTGGAVLYTSAKPTAQLSAKVYGGVANYHTWSAGGYISGPLTDALRVRAAVDYKNDGGFGEVLAGKQKGERTGHYERFGARGVMEFAPTTNFKNTLIVQYTKFTDHAGPAYQILDTPRTGKIFIDSKGNPVYDNPADVFFNQFAGGLLNSKIASQRAKGPYNVEYDSYNGGSVKAWSVSNTTTLELASNLTLKNIFGYRKMDYWDSVDYDGTSLNLLQASNAGNGKTFTEELQLQGNAFDNRLDFIFGGYYFHQKGSEGTGTPYMDVRNQPPGTTAFGGTARLQFTDIVNSSFSAFGQVGYKLTDSLKLNAGIRYTVDTRQSSSVVGTVSKTVFNNNAPVPATCEYKNAAGGALPATFADCRITGKASFSEPSWLIGLDWKVDTDTLIYVTSRHSYRAGGFQSRPFDNTTATQTFNPEKVTDIELGLKRDWDLGGDTRLRTNVAGYYQWYSDIQRSSSTLTPVGVGNVVRNAAKAHILGFEIETELKFGDIAALSVNYAYTKPKYESYPTSYYEAVSGTFVPQDRTRYPFPGIVTSQLNGNLTVTPDVGKLGQMALVASLYYQSFMYFSEDYFDAPSLAAAVPPGAVQPFPADVFYGQKPYALVNLTAQLDKIMGTGFGAKFWVRNVFDKRFVDAGIAFQNSIGFGMGVYGAPRTFGLDLSYQF